MQQVQGKKYFDKVELYRFYFDKDNIADNCRRKFMGKVGNAVEVSIKLIELID
jgi:hypothetical protein